VPPPSGASDAGDAGIAAGPRTGGGTGSGTGNGPSNNTAVEIAPLPSARAPAEARLPTSSAPPSGDAAAWKYIVTDGPQGPVVTVAPAR
jgi:hypothetical protein